jgi:spore coat polysaccharide biosynthesis protein SpsF
MDWNETVMKLNPRDPSVVAIIQARMGSSRLPGKVLKDLCGEPLLLREVVRVRRAQTIGQVVVATTVDPQDTPIVDMCRSYGVPCFRGDPHDVLDRYCRAAQLFNAETIVRLTGDCPLIDPREIDRTVRAFFDANVDFAANRLPPPWKRTTPIGMDTEVVGFENLSRAWREAKSKYAREHVMPYFYEKEGRFEILLVEHEPDLSEYRLTVDTVEDLALIRKIYTHFEGSEEFSLGEVVALLKAHPEWVALNAQVTPKNYQETDVRF